VEAGYSVQIQARDTRKKRWEQLDDDFSYDPNQLDRDVVATGQNRDAHGCANVAGGRMPGATTIVRTFCNKLLTEILPGRTWVPKTLIFAKGDAETGEHPVDVRPAERVRHGWRTLGFRAERDARAKKHTHTENIVEIVREEFGKSNDFAQKIT
jgi:type I restriction enzyme R subunit